MDPKIIETCLVVAFVVLSLGIHEAAHAWVAYLCGDSTAKNLGRMTLNPIPHIDPIMTIAVPAFMYYTLGYAFGGAKPVPVNPFNLRKPLRDMMLVAIAGPLSNLILAVIFMLVWKILIYEVGMDEDALGPVVMQWSMIINVILALFNMLPVPPLDGSRVMAYMLPSGLRETYVSLERFGMIIVVVLVFSGAFRVFLTSTLWPTVDLLTYLTGGVW